jgi:hypothetical protein
LQHGPDFLTGQDDRQPTRDLGTDDAFERWEVQVQDFAVEKQQSVQLK